MKRPIAAALGAALLMCAAGSAAAQAWFGVPLPPPLTPPDQPTFHAGPAAYGPQPAHVRPKDDAAGALSAPKLMADVKTIVGFSLERKAAGDPLWGRISGLPGEARTVEWAVAQLKAAGLKDAHAETYAFDAPLWLPKSSSVTLSGDPAFGAGSADLVLRSAVPTRNSASVKGELSAPLIFVGRGSAAELANVDVKGKIAVVNVVPDDSLYASREKGVAHELEKRGALGVINAVESPGNLLYYDTRYGCDAAPCFLLGGDDGAFLESVIGKAAAAGKTITARIRLETEQRSGLTALNGMAVIPGKSPEVVIVNAHADAWWDGANDNADGLATLIGLARYFAHRKTPPARTLVFMVSGGHHTANGAAAFIKAHPEIIGKTVLVMNLEHTAQVAVTQAPRLDPAQDHYASSVWTASTAESPKLVGAANSTPFVWSLMGKASKRYGVTTGYEPTASAPGDLGAYIRAGLPSAQLISSEVYYHSSGDTPSTISLPGLERGAAFYAGLIDDVAKAPAASLKGPPAPPQRR
jgi:hypothetical protein